MKQELTKLKGEIEKLNIIRNFTICASRNMQTKKLARIKDLNDINHADITDVYITLPSKITECTFLKSTQNTPQD